MQLREHQKVPGSVRLIQSFLQRSFCYVQNTSAVVETKHKPAEHIQRSVARSLLSVIALSLALQSAQLPADASTSEAISRAQVPQEAETFIFVAHWRRRAASKDDMMRNCRPLGLFSWRKCKTKTLGVHPVFQSLEAPYFRRNELKRKEKKNLLL